ncbi:MAG: hypothetical protein K0Q91_453 [Fibrobacteria bacterium]|jgi:hypothetical protein|nr:hypothetical protein [Fibrobacteria bacterium]
MLKTGKMRYKLTQSPFVFGPRFAKSLNGRGTNRKVEAPGWF